MATLNDESRQRDRTVSMLKTATGSSAVSAVSNSTDPPLDDDLIVGVRLRRDRTLYDRVEAQKSMESFETLSWFRYMLLINGVVPSGFNAGTSYSQQPTTYRRILFVVKRFVGISYVSAIWAAYMYQIIYLAALPDPYRYVAERTAWGAVYVAGLLLQILQLYFVTYKRLLHHAVKDYYAQCMASDAVTAQEKAAEATTTATATEADGSGRKTTAVHKANVFLKWVFRRHTGSSLFYGLEFFLVWQVGMATIEIYTFQDAIILFSAFQLIFVVTGASVTHTLLAHLMFARLKQLLDFTSGRSRSTTESGFSKARMQWILETRSSIAEKVQRFHALPLILTMVLLTALSVWNGSTLAVILLIERGQYPSIFSFVPAGCVLMLIGAAYAVSSKPFRHWYALEQRLRRLKKVHKHHALAALPSPARVSAPLSQEQLLPSVAPSSFPAPDSATEKRHLLTVPTAAAHAARSGPREPRDDVHHAGSFLSSSPSPSPSSFSSDIALHPVTPSSHSLPVTVSVREEEEEEPQTQEDEEEEQQLNTGQAHKHQQRDGLHAPDHATGARTRRMSSAQLQAEVNSLVSAMQEEMKVRRKSYLQALPPSAVIQLSRLEKQPREATDPRRTPDPEQDREEVASEHLGAASSPAEDEEEPAGLPRPLTATSSVQSTEEVVLTTSNPVFEMSRFIPLGRQPSAPVLNTAALMQRDKGVNLKSVALQRTTRALYAKLLLQMTLFLVVWLAIFTYRVFISYPSCVQLTPTSGIGFTYYQTDSSSCSLARRIVRAADSSFFTYVSSLTHHCFFSSLSLARSLARSVCVCVCVHSVSCVIVLSRSVR